MRAKHLLVAAVALSASVAQADLVELKNGDKINGKVGEIAGGKMKFSSPVLGEITIDMANVTSYSTDEPVRILKQGRAPIVSEKIIAGDATRVETAGGTTLPAAEIKMINPPPEKWTGFVLANLSLARGNTQTMDVGVEAQGVLRRINERHDDRLTLYGEYNFANVGTGSDAVTTEENVEAYAKYDRFFTPKLYGYANLAFMKDHIANLDYRFTPGIGLGYQWFESPALNFSTEAGFTYVFEYYDPGGSNDFPALRLAYHVDKQLADKVKVFHNLVYLPSLQDPLEDYLITADAGVQVDLPKSMFTQLKVEWEYDSTPSPGLSNNDYRFLIGAGWRF